MLQVNFTELTTGSLLFYKINRIINKVPSLRHITFCYLSGCSVS